MGTRARGVAHTFENVADEHLTLVVKHDSTEDVNTMTDTNEAPAAVRAAAAYRDAYRAAYDAAADAAARTADEADAAEAAYLAAHAAYDAATAAYTDALAATK